MQSPASGSWAEPRPVIGLLDAGARMYLRRFRPFFLVSLVTSVVGWLLGLLAPRPALVTGAPFGVSFTAGVGAANPVLAILAALVGLAGTAALIALAGAEATGAAVTATPTRIVGQGLSRYWPLLVATVLIGVVVAAGFVLVVVPGVLFLTWWAVGPVAVVLEGRRATGALGRSRSLVRGLFWHALGALFFAGVIGAAAAWLLALVGLPFALLHAGIVYQLWATLVRAAVAPYDVCVLVLLYYDLRARKEAFDLVGAGTPASPA